MNLPIKPRRVDFCAGDWLGGTVALSLAERGLYITACAMIYDAGGPIHKADLRQAAGGRSDTFGLLLLKLVDKGKLQLRDGMIDQVRCQREIARARERITEKTTTRVKSVSDPSVSSSSTLNENNEVTPPYARAEVYQATKEDLESYPEPSESVAAREGFSINERGLGRFAPAAEPHPPPEPDPPNPEQAAEVDALVERAVTALRGGVPKGIRDAVAYQAAVKANKFHNLVKTLNAWVGTGLDGEARFAAWEVLAAAERAGVRSGMTRAARRDFDKLALMYRATAPPDLEQAA